MHLSQSLESAMRGRRCLVSHLTPMGSFVRRAPCFIGVLTGDLELPGD